MIQIPVPVKVLECLCVYKKKMNEKAIARVVSEDQKSVGFALRELSNRGILVEEDTNYYLNPDFKESCEKIVEIYKAVKLSKEQKLYGIYLEELYKRS